MPDRGILPGILDQPRSFARRLLLLACLAALASAPSNASAATLDTTRPSMPTAVTAWAVGCNQINLAWNASTDTGGSGVGAYNVYVVQSSGWAFLKQVLATTTSGGCAPARYTTSITGLTARTTYYYSVAAVDKAGNASAQSGFVTAALPACVTATTVTTSTSTTTTLVSGDKTAPAMPTGVTASACGSPTTFACPRPRTSASGARLRRCEAQGHGAHAGDFAAASRLPFRARRRSCLRGSEYTFF